MQLISGFYFVSFKGWLLKKSNSAKIQMQLKSKDEFLWYKGQVPLPNLCFMRPNMKSLKMSDLQGRTQKSVEQAWAELGWNLQTCNGNNRVSLPGRAAAMRKDVLFGQPVLWIPWSLICQHLLITQSFILWSFILWLGWIFPIKLHLLESNKYFNTSFH